MDVTVKAEAVQTNNGHIVQATFYRPDHVTHGAVLVASAMGVPQSYYAAFAAWLARQGYLVATFDYTGMGKSLTGHLKDVQADVLTWARNDCAAMVDVLEARVVRQPVYWIGHSLGGQVLALTPNHAKIKRALFIASGSGYWRENSAPLKRRVWLLWYVLVPTLVPALGYFPGKRLNMVGDLPKGVIQQWRRWCLHPEYALGVEGEPVRQQYDAVHTPIISLSFSDDEFMSAANIASLTGFYRNAPKRVVRLSSNGDDGARIGHFGFFKSQFESQLWAQHVLPALQMKEE